MIGSPVVKVNTIDYSSSTRPVFGEILHTKNSQTIEEAEKAPVKSIGEDESTKKPLMAILNTQPSQLLCGNMEDASKRRNIDMLRKSPLKTSYTSIRVIPYQDSSTADKENAPSPMRSPTRRPVTQTLRCKTPVQVSVPQSPLPPQHSIFSPVPLSGGKGLPLTPLGGPFSRRASSGSADGDAPRVYSWQGAVRTHRQAKENVIVYNDIPVSEKESELSLLDDANNSNTVSEEEEGDPHTAPVSVSASPAMQMQPPRVSPKVAASAAVVNSPVVIEPPTSKPARRGHSADRSRSARKPAAEAAIDAFTAAAYILDVKRQQTRSLSPRRFSSSALAAVSTQASAVVSTMPTDQNTKEAEDSSQQDLLNAAAPLPAVSVPVSVHVPASKQKFDLELGSSYDIERSSSSYEYSRSGLAAKTPGEDRLSRRRTVLRHTHREEEKLPISSAFRSPSTDKYIHSGNAESDEGAVCVSNMGVDSASHEAAPLAVPAMCYVAQEPPASRNADLADTEPQVHVKMLTHDTQAKKNRRKINRAVAPAEICKTPFRLKDTKVEKRLPAQPVRFTLPQEQAQHEFNHEQIEDVADKSEHDNQDNEGDDSNESVDTYFSTVEEVSLEPPDHSQLEHEQKYQHQSQGQKDAKTSSLAATLATRYDPATVSPTQYGQHHVHQLSCRATSDGRALLGVFARSRRVSRISEEDISAAQALTSLSVADQEHLNKERKMEQVSLSAEEEAAAGAGALNILRGAHSEKFSIDSASCSVSDGESDSDGEIAAELRAHAKYMEDISFLSDTYDSPEANQEAALHTEADTDIGMDWNNNTQENVFEASVVTAGAVYGGIHLPHLPSSFSPESADSRAWANIPLTPEQAQTQVPGNHAIKSPAASSVSKPVSASVQAQAAATSSHPFGHARGRKSNLHDSALAFAATYGTEGDMRFLLASLPASKQQPQIAAYQYSAPTSSQSQHKETAHPPMNFNSDDDNEDDDGSDLTFEQHVAEPYEFDFQQTRANQLAKEATEKKEGEEESSELSTDDFSELDLEISYGSDDKCAQQKVTPIRLTLQQVLSMSSQKSAMKPTTPLGSLIKSYMDRSNLEFSSDLSRENVVPAAPASDATDADVDDAISLAESDNESHCSDGGNKGFWESWKQGLASTSKPLQAKSETTAATAQVSEKEVAAKETIEVFEHVSCPYTPSDKAAVNNIDYSLEASPRALERLNEHGMIEDKLLSLPKGEQVSPHMSPCIPASHMSTMFSMPTSLSLEAQLDALSQQPEQNTSRNTDMTALTFDDVMSFDQGYSQGNKEGTDGHVGDDELKLALAQVHRDADVSAAEHTKEICMQGVVGGSVSTFVRVANKRPYPMRVSLRPIVMRFDAKKTFHIAAEDDDASDNVLPFSKTSEVFQASPASAVLSPGCDITFSLVFTPPGRGKHTSNAAVLAGIYSGMCQLELRSVNSGIGKNKDFSLLLRGEAAEKSYDAQESAILTQEPDNEQQLKQETTQEINEEIATNINHLFSSPQGAYLLTRKTEQQRLRKQFLDQQHQEQEEEQAEEEEEQNITQMTPEIDEDSMEVGNSTNWFSSPLGAHLLTRKAEQQKLRKEFEHLQWLKHTQHNDITALSEYSTEEKEDTAVVVEGQFEEPAQENLSPSDLFSSPVGANLLSRKAMQQKLRKEHEHTQWLRLRSLHEDLSGIRIDMYDTEGTDVQEGSEMQSPLERRTGSVLMMGDEIDGKSDMGLEFINSSIDQLINKMETFMQVDANGNCESNVTRSHAINSTPTPKNPQSEQKYANYEAMDALIKKMDYIFTSPADYNTSNNTSPATHTASAEQGSKESTNPIVPLEETSEERIHSPSPLLSPLSTPAMKDASFSAAAVILQANGKATSSSTDVKQQAKEAKKARKRQRLAEKRKQKKWGAAAAAVAAAQPEMQGNMQLNDSSEQITCAPVAATPLDWANSSDASVPALSESIMQRHSFKSMNSTTAAICTTKSSILEAKKTDAAEISSNSLQAHLSDKHTWLKHWILKQSSSPPRAHLSLDPKSPPRSGAASDASAKSVSATKPVSSADMWNSPPESPMRAPEMSVQSPSRPVPPPHPESAHAGNPFDACTGMTPTLPGNSANAMNIECNSNSNSSSDVKQNPFDRYDFTDYFAKRDDLQATVTTSRAAGTSISTSTEKRNSPTAFATAPHSSSSSSSAEVASWGFTGAGTGTGTGTTESPNVNVMALESYWLSPLAAVSLAAGVAQSMSSMPAPTDEPAPNSAAPATPGTPVYDPPAVPTPAPAAIRVFITTSINANEDSEEEAEKADQKHLEEMASLCTSTVLLAAKVADKSCSPLPLPLENLQENTSVPSFVALPNILDVSQTSVSNATQTEDIAKVSVVPLVGHGAFGALSKQLEQERAAYRQHKQLQADSYVSQQRQVLEQLSEPSEAQTYTQHSDVYFSRRAASFGAAVVGSISRLKVELCNPKDTEVTVHLAELPLPFVVLHKEIQLGARAYVRIPVRFLPSVTRSAEDGPYTCDLKVTTAGGHSAAIALEAFSFSLEDKFVQ